MKLNWKNNKFKNKVISTFTLTLVLVGIIIPFQGLASIGAKEADAVIIDDSNATFTIENAEDNKFKLTNIEVKDLQYTTINVNVQGNIVLENDSVADSNVKI